MALDRDRLLARCCYSLEQWAGMGRSCIFEPGSTTERRHGAHHERKPCCRSECSALCVVYGACAALHARCMPRRMPWCIPRCMPRCMPLCIPRCMPRCMPRWVHAMLHAMLHAVVHAAVRAAVGACRSACHAACRVAYLCSVLSTSSLYTGLPASVITGVPCIVYMSPCLHILMQFAAAKTLLPEGTGVHLIQLPASDETVAMQSSSL